MPNQNGTVYGLTLLSPIIHDPNAVPIPLPADPRLSRHPPHWRREPLRLRSRHPSLPPRRHGRCHLRRRARHRRTSQVQVPRLRINCDGDLDAYLTGLAHSSAAPRRHLEPLYRLSRRRQSATAFLSYMKACQIDTTFFFAAVNNSRSPNASRPANAASRRRLHRHRQGMDPAQIQRDFIEFTNLATADPSRTRQHGPAEHIKTGGRNE